MLGVELPQRLEPRGVGVHGPRLLVHGPQHAGEEVDGAGVERGDDALEVGGRLGGHVVLGAAGLGGEPADLATEVRRPDDLRRHLAGHLEAVAGERALGAVERERRLAGHEPHEVGGVGGVALATVAAQELADRGRASDHDLVLRRAAARGPGAVAQRPAAGEDVGETQQHAVGLGIGRPDHSDGDEQRVVAAGQARGELLAVGGQHLEAPPARLTVPTDPAEPAVDEAALHAGGRVDEDDERPIPGVREDRRVDLGAHVSHLPRLATPRIRRHRRTCC